MGGLRQRNGHRPKSMYKGGTRAVDLHARQSGTCLRRLRSGKYGRGRQEGQSVAAVSNLRKLSSGGLPLPRLPLIRVHLGISLSYVLSGEYEVSGIEENKAELIHRQRTDGTDGRTHEGGGEYERMGREERYAINERTNAKPMTKELEEGTPL